LKKWGERTANERVEAALPARYDGGKSRDIDNDRVHEGGVGRDDENGRLLAARLPPYDLQVHPPDLVGAAAQPAERAHQPPAPIKNAQNLPKNNSQGLKKTKLKQALSRKSCCEKR